jgi:hypothetical protein
MLENQALYLERTLQDYESEDDADSQKIDELMSAVAGLEKSLKDLKGEGDDVKGEDVAELQRLMLFQQEEINRILNSQEDEDVNRPDLFGESKPPPPHPELFSFKN